MTQQEIEAFALQYAHIECVVTEQATFTPIEWLYEINAADKEIEILDIELRSIDSLTNEEAKESGFYDTADILNFLSNGGSLNFYETDYLRSIGIAVPFRGYSVEQMIKQGILKLKP